MVTFISERQTQMDSTQLDRVVLIAQLRVQANKLQILLNETRTSRKAEYKDYSYPVLMGHKREVVEKELATINVQLMLLGAKT